ncbi:hypothetical protein BaRGS_00021417 [Batillaria attramentaria]|uniref:Uncharacterized protein n=1 Tax=Batillaria attramentaria TaxID=370345 RepID=A0ABD0KJD1_9CAEN
MQGKETGNYTRRSVLQASLPFPERLLLLVLAAVLAEVLSRGVFFLYQPRCLQTPSNFSVKGKPSIGSAALWKSWNGTP